MIANTIIKKVLKKLLVISGGREPSEQQYADGLETLNDVVKSWSANINLIYEDTFEEIDIPAGTQSFLSGAITGQAQLGTNTFFVVLDASLSKENDYYKGYTLTITDGAGAGQSRTIAASTGAILSVSTVPAADETSVFILSTPSSLLQITHASIKEGETEYPLRILDKTQYQNVTDKSTTGLPYGIHYRDTWPNSTLYFSHTTDKAYTLILSSFKALTNFPDGTTEVSLPSYYEKAFKDNLLIEWASELGAAKRITPLMVQIAEESKSTIVGQSIKMNASTTELSSRGVYNIQADSY